MRTGLLWVLCAVTAIAVSLAARVVFRRRGSDELAGEAAWTTLPLLAGTLLGIVTSGPVEPRALGTLAGAVLLGLPWVWQPRRGNVLIPRTLAVLGAILIAVASGIRIDSFKHPISQLPVDTGPAAVPITAVWLAVVTLAFYTTKRLEGMPLPLVSISATAFTLIILIQRQHLTLARGLGAGLSGAATGLMLLALLGLRPPARDGTAAAAGFLMGAAAVVGLSKTSAVLSLVIPLLVLAVPALSMTTLVLDRIRQRVVVTEVRQDFYGLLLNRGLPKHKVIILIAAIQAYFAGVAVLLAVLRALSPVVKGSVFVLATVAAAPLFSRFLRILLRASSLKQAGGPTQLLEMKLDSIGMREAIGRIEEFIQTREPHHIVTGDTSALGRVLDDPTFRDVVNAAHMVTADGIGVLWAARLLGLPISERVPGVDLMEALFARSAERGYGLFFLGGQPGVAEEAARNVKARYPDLRIVGTRHGYFDSEDEPAIVQEIRNAAPDVLFVALGSPRQDHWIRRHIAQLGVPACIGVGGSLDVLAGRLRRAPRWMQQMGLEWVYRAVQEPWRVQRWSRFPRVISESVKRKIISYWS